MPSMDLVFRFLGVDAGAGPEFDRMAGKAGGASKALKGLALAGAATAAAVGIESVRLAASFQTSMTRLQTQANVSTKNVAAFSKGIEAMAGSVATTPNTLALAAYHIASVGQKSWTTAQQLKVLKVAAEGAKIGGADLVDVTNTLDALLISHLKGIKNYSQAMGVLNSVVGAGDMQMQDLADALGPLGSTFKGFGVSVQQAGAALAVLGDNGIRGRLAGSQLRQSITALADPLSFGASQLQSWGIKSGNLSKQLGKGGLTDALDTLANKLHAAGYTAKTMGPILAEMFGKRGPQQGLSTLINQLDRYHGKLGEVTHGGDTFASSWKGYTKTFGYALDAARSAAESLLIELGTKMLPTVTKFTNWIAQKAIPALSQFAGWLKRNQGDAKIMGAALAGLIIYIEGPVAGIAALAIGLTVLYKRSQTFRSIVRGALQGTIAVFQS
jgi:trimeric autotransporter adhesin